MNGSQTQTEPEQQQEIQYLKLTSMRLITEYNPIISKPAKAFIKSEVTPSMTSYDGESNQYSISYCIDILEQEQKIFEQDLEILNGLAQEGVDHIEF